MALEQVLPKATLLTSDVASFFLSGQLGNFVGVCETGVYRLFLKPLFLIGCINARLARKITAWAKLGDVFLELDCARTCQIVPISRHGFAKRALLYPLAFKKAEILIRSG